MTQANDRRNGSVRAKVLRHREKSAFTIRGLELLEPRTLMAVSVGARALAKTPTELAATAPFVERIADRSTPVAEITVTRRGDISKPFVAPVDVVGGTARGGSDYRRLALEQMVVRFAPGQTMATLRVPTLPTKEAQPLETIDLRIGRSTRLERPVRTSVVLASTAVTSSDLPTIPGADFDTLYKSWYESRPILRGTYGAPIQGQSEAGGNSAGGVQGMIKNFSGARMHVRTTWMDGGVSEAILEPKDEMPYQLFSAGKLEFRRVTHGVPVGEPAVLWLKDPSAGLPITAFTPPGRSEAIDTRTDWRQGDVHQAVWGGTKMLVKREKDGWQVPTSQEYLSRYANPNGFGQRDWATFTIQVDALQDGMPPPLAVSVVSNADAWDGVKGVVTNKTNATLMFFLEGDVSIRSIVPGQAMAFYSGYIANFWFAPLVWDYKVGLKIADGQLMQRPRTMFLPNADRATPKTERTGWAEGESHREIWGSTDLLITRANDYSWSGTSERWENKDWAIFMVDINGI